MTDEQDSADSAPDPPLGVHVLSEYIYCQRAGLHAYEQDDEDQGREDPILRLDYLHCYELWEIEKRLAAHLSGIWQLVYLTGAFALLGILLGFLAHGAFFWAGLGAVAFLGFPLVRQLITVIKLDSQRRQARGATAAEPDPDSPNDEPVGWWALKAAGLEAMLCEQSLVDPQMNLRGCPWRILRRGDLSIPVLIRKSPGPLRRQQRARVAAYCHLIRVCEGAESPYGVVLDQGTYRGIAVKPKQSDLQLVRARLERLRHVIKEAERYDQRPPPPEHHRECTRCPIGRPRRYRPGVTETKRHTQLLPVYGSRVGPKEVIFHSRCGDRFGWWPPHEDAAKLDYVN